MNTEIIVHKLLDKYRASTLNGLVIKKLICNNLGSVKLLMEDDTINDVFLSLDADSVVNYSADYILCLIQDISGMAIKKY